MVIIEVVSLTETCARLVPHVDNGTDLFASCVALSNKFKLDFKSSGAKNDTRSRQLKERANQHYRQGSYKDAAADYTRAVRFGQERALLADLYANRAMTLMKLGKRTEARADLDYAVHYGYGVGDETKRRKLAHRMADLKDVVIDDKKRESHAHYVNAKIELCSSDSKGRFIRAREELKSGELILAERAQASVSILVDEFITYCCHCHRQLFPYHALSCDGCAAMVYCSLECRQHHRKLHECCFTGLLNSAGISYLAYALLIKLAEHVNDDHAQLDQGIKFMTGHYNHQTHSRINYAVLAWLLLKFHYRNQVECLITVEMLDKCTSLLYIVQMNSSAIFDAETGQPVAAALFSNLSLLNHSCAPNISLEHEVHYWGHIGLNIFSRSSQIEHTCDPNIVRLGICLCETVNPGRR